MTRNTLPAAWESQARHDLARRVVHAPGQGWVTAGDLHARAETAAGGLAEAGLRSGDRLVMSAGASVDLIAMHIGALRAGLVVVPANTAYTAPELAHVAEDSGATAAFVDDRAKTDLPQVGFAETPQANDRSDPDQPAMIIYTSGTTGKPKGAVLSHANLLAGAQAVVDAWRWTSADRLILALPLFHMHGLGIGVHGTLLAGGSMVLVPRFDPDAVFDAIQEHDATMFFGVPTMYARLAAHARVGELGRLRLCVSGSAPLPPELHRRLQDKAGQRVLERYGLSETLMNTSNPYDGDRRPGSVGLPLPRVEVRLAAETDEIEVRGPNVFRGYWRNPEATKAAFTDDGWFKTGDVGALDPDGYLRIVGRTKELIISGGFNVYPREIEEALESHPAVAEAAVVGTPDPEWGEVVTAHVVTGAPVTEEELRDHCRQSLAPYKQPRIFRFVETIPRNALGKIDRRSIRTEPPAK